MQHLIVWSIGIEHHTVSSFTEHVNQPTFLLSHYHCHSLSFARELDGMEHFKFVILHCMHI